MSRNLRERVLAIAGVVVLLSPVVAVAGLTPQGLTPQGLTPQGLTPQGLTPQGLTPQGLTPQGLTPQGLTPQGLTPQGLTPQGLTPQGLTPQGLTPQGVALMGTDVLTPDFKGVAIASVEIHGTTSSSAKMDYELTSIPGVSTGLGNYIVLSPGAVPAKGHYAVAKMVDGIGNPAENLDLYIADEAPDTVPNQFHRADAESNQDELYVVYFYYPWAGEWISLCPYNALTKSASAMAIAEDPTNPDPDKRNTFFFACTATGVASKCARNWGYRPWAHTQAYEFHDPNWVLEDKDLKPYYEICKFAAMADYCQSGHTFTKAGTLVDLFDTRQIIWPNAIQNPWNAANKDSLWMMAQEYFISFDAAGHNPPQSLQQDSALQRTRYQELSPVGSPPGTCDQFTYVTRLEHDNIEDGHWASPLTNTPRLQVFSPTSCKHTESVEGEVLPWDCSPCTTQVCKTMPQCCGGLGGTSWDASCVNQAAMVCKTGVDKWPAGRVWPKEADISAVLAKYLLGPNGAVLRTDGTSGLSSSATVSGWACDPEWPGASVAVRIYDAPREQGGTQLGEVRADQPLSPPLLGEVSLACDGTPAKTSARHGFSFTLPANQTGNVFVYAIDQDTDDGVAAPPTLVRNGIVHVPTCAHGEHEGGDTLDALDASCSACAGAVCGDGTHASCCTTAWTDDCAAAAAGCAPATASETSDSREFAAAASGWIEAPTDGTYLFDASAQPSRLFINGTKVLDWFGGAGIKQGSIDLMGGVRYHFRWDRFQSAPPSGPAQGVTWQPPGAGSLGPISPHALYELAPGAGTGLAVTYVDNLTGTPYARVDATVDINTDVAPPSPPSPPAILLPATVTPATGYGATWEGEIVPSYSESYSFTFIGSGVPTLTIGGNLLAFPPPSGGSVAAGTCPHDLCKLGDKIPSTTTLNPACDTCVDKVCENDPYCCDGGYLSYYSTQPTWDAKCVSEVNAYCLPLNQCTTPLPNPVSPEQTSASIALVAGVHYHLLLQYTNATGDPTARLMWSSDRQMKQVVPQFALFPTGGAAAGGGSGLNLTTFATKTVSGVLQPDLDTVVGSGEISDLSITAPVGPQGTPVVDAIASPEDLAAATPSPPAIVRPRFGDTIALDSSATLDVHGIGGLTGGAVHIFVVEDAADFLVPVSGDGTFIASIPLGGSGTRTRTLNVSQRTYSGGSCVPPAVCLESVVVPWPLTITDAASNQPPAISSPVDLTTSPAQVDLVVPVIGTGTPNVPLQIDDQGLFGVSTLPTTLAVSANGVISGSITLSHGSPSNPNPGWHKLVFSQGGGVAAPPVFVSVGIDPPTVTFPRSGAKIDCKPNAPDPREFTAKGSVRYSETQFGPLRVAEETGLQHLNFVDRDTSISQTQSQDGTFAFQATVALTYGRHLLYFFQAKNPPQGANVDEYYRAFASLANTPTSRIVVNVPPPRIPIPPGLAGVVLTRAFTNIKLVDALPGQLPGPPTLAIDIGDCGPNAQTPSDLCVQPYADVNLTIGKRIFTARANADGAWKLAAQVPQGWSQASFTQVVDSPAGGAWQEGCPSNELSVGGGTPGGPSITHPGNLTFNATSPAGAAVSYDVTAVSAVTGAQVPVDCKPPSGTVFPLGTTPVLCTAVDAGKVSVATFSVTVQDGPPLVTVPADITAEATSSLGALVSYDATATDAATGGPLPIDCTLASPVQVQVNIPTTVSCSASNAAGQTTTKTFAIHVVDTTPPTLCALPNIQIGTNAGAGAFVSFGPCGSLASDIVDGTDPVTCDHPSGSFFLVGTTLVSCIATDNNHNTSPPSQFTVSVGDTTPPVLTVPADITVTAQSRLGARVSYVATATDNVDPHPTVVCVPPSGAQFPLGNTTVNCTATDASGNQSHRSFHVRVVVSWTGFLFPIANDGSTRWEHNVPLPVRFALTGASAGIFDLTAKLFVAPLDASGHAGTEVRAVKIPPINANTFDFIPIINQYLLLMDTRPQGIAAWQLRVDLGDGVPHTVRVTFTP